MKIHVSRLLPAAFVAVAGSAIAAPTHVPFVHDSSLGARTVYVSNIYPEEILAFRKSRTVAISGPRTGIRNPFFVALTPNGDIAVVNPAVPKHNLPGSVVVLAPKPNARATTSITCDGFYPGTVAVDGASNLWVTDAGTQSVLVYAPGSMGCATPIATIGGRLTRLRGPYGVALDARGRTDVLSVANDSVEVFAPGATGNVAPIARIAGARTQIDQPEGLAVDGQGNIYVTDYVAGKVLEFAADANGNASPIRVIGGSNTLLGACSGLAVSRVNGDIYVANLDTESVLVFDANANGNVSPKAQIGSGIFPTGVALAE